MPNKNRWQRVVFANDLPCCDCCGEPYCPKHDKHYWECECVGPTQDGYEYEERPDGLYARKLED